MNIRKLATIVAMSALTLPAVAATTFVGGELGYIDQPTLTKSRAQVLGEFEAFRANPVDAAGGRHVGGEQGYVMPAPKAGTASVPAVKTPAEARQFLDAYPA